MPDIRIIDPKPYHCGQMARYLRDKHMDVLEKLGTNAHRTLRDSFDNSSYRKAMTIDGRIAVLGGSVGPAISTVGYVWFAATDEAKRYPVAMVKAIKQALAEIVATKHEVSSLVLFGDLKAQRFALFMGFDFSDVPQSATQDMAFLVKYQPQRPRSWSIQ